ncbi:uncharacterized protein PHACADRAFT_186480 [Phanerochaete carnosa HHB-10118-sp]|uniref:Uncharacterized protein n=1 Tax=Phanerochaete carnosa (strain HHB-10118-sp) TaxID=650164 RepID=K5W0D0_PHACS|nr:uncharacterized protein PHACADRAFT_186480 [Phanerochaete carnosa HHB-10118-sp]EKM52304.1 hypothetical protein PHACADRAFT_186480 [Phanerochaete carnosa HHB-10118-sp]
MYAAHGIERPKLRAVLSGMPQLAFLLVLVFQLTAKRYLSLGLACDNGANMRDFGAYGGDWQHRMLNARRPGPGRTMKVCAFYQKGSHKSQQKAVFVNVLSAAVGLEAIHSALLFSVFSEHGPGNMPNFLAGSDANSQTLKPALS